MYVCPVAFVLYIFLAVHGFDSTKYYATEGATLIFKVILLVKGEVDRDELSALLEKISTQSITAG